MLAEATGAEPAEMCVAAQQRDRAHGGGLAFRGGNWGPRRQARGCGWAAAVEHRGERPGALRVTCSPDEPLTPPGEPAGAQRDRPGRPGAAAQCRADLGSAGLPPAPPPPRAPGCRHIRPAGGVRRHHRNRLSARRCASRSQPSGQCAPTPGLLEYHGRCRTGPGPLRVALAAVSRAGRRGPLGPAPAHRTPQRPRLTGSRRPRHRPERPARGHLFRSRTRRCRSGRPGSPRRCVPGRPVLAAGGAPGCGSGCGGRSSP
jgi:hypothetical protein